MTRYGDIARVINGLESSTGFSTNPYGSLFSLRNGFTAYFVLSPVNGSFATVAPEKLASQSNLTPAPRRQDHTTSPYAIGHARQSQLSRPPHLTARS